MKTEDFERLKSICEKEGFELRGEDPLTGFACVVSKKDPWEGVEFVEHIPLGIVFKPMSIKALMIDLDNEIGFSKDICKPSTEEAYVEQLKKYAFERFGEIKEGDRFDRSSIDLKWGSNIIMEKCRFGNFHFKYDKSSDTLFIGKYGIYSKGKWAERVKEKIKVKSTYIFKEPEGFSLKFSLSIDKNVGFVEASFLAKQLEKYLNNEL